jgi:hypothetical protein
LKPATNVEAMENTNHWAGLVKLASFGVKNPDTGKWDSFSKSSKLRPVTNLLLRGKVAWLKMVFGT